MQPKQDSATKSAHYDDSYYSWQSPLGEFGAWANQTRFQEFISPVHTVLDFGCGGGKLLQALDVARRIGVEINPAARQDALQSGIEMYSAADACPDNVADVIISNNALEHATRPLDELKFLLPKLKPGGLCVFMVPCEHISYRYKPGDINHHLYSWSPMAIGNLFTEAGFELLESKAWISKWPPGYRTIARVGGRRVFEVACRVYGRLARRWFQVRVVARRPINS